MDIEFHYYITYLIATRAGFSNDTAFNIAYSAQHVDDNVHMFVINKNQEAHYENYISQTLNILKPRDKLFRIYPLFHFIPGDCNAESARRKDGKMHILNTTPNSVNVNTIMDVAMATGDPYRIGIASHAYVDSWAHQNFVGYYEGFNSLKGVLEAATPNIGHADAQHKPDITSLIWKDTRLISKNEMIDNNQRFLNAATALFAKFKKYNFSNVTNDNLEQEAQSLSDDLLAIISNGGSDKELKKQRIKHYSELGNSLEYGKSPVPKYDEKFWFEEAIQTDIRGIPDKWVRWDPLKDRYYWKSTAEYQQSHWYQFQQAVKQHQNTAWDILEGPVFSNIELANL